MTVSPPPDRPDADRRPPHGRRPRWAEPPTGELRFRRPGSPRRSVGLAVLALLMVIAGGTVAGVVMKAGSSATRQQIATAGAGVTIPGSRSSPTLPATDAEVMGLQKVSPAPAPGFALTDQHGRTVSLATLEQDHVVVLTFMDDRCTDVCPIVAQELSDAYHDLGARSARVAFVGVNVNAAHNATKWLDAFIAQHSELAGLPDFRYLTGSPAALVKVWKAYHVTVDVQNGTVYHSETMDFIAPGGIIRYRATPFANLRQNGTGWLPAATIAQWGQGIARYAEAAGTPA